MQLREEEEGTGREFADRFGGIVGGTLVDLRVHGFHIFVVLNYIHFHSL